MQNKFFYSARNFQIYSVFFLALALFLIVAASMQRTEGRLIYTLDDPYIHLAVSESILEGGYGINAGEYASPSSSIIYSLLLVVPLMVGLGDFGPLLYAIPASLISIWLISGFVWTSLHSSFGRRAPLAFFLVGPALVLALNAVALPMTGMEHSLHVLGVTAVFSGLMALTAPSRSGGLAMTLFGAAICATIRFEGLALAYAAIGALFVLGHRLQSMAAFVAITCVLAIYALFMMSHGLPIFPSSVLTKSPIALSVTESSVFGLIKAVVINLFEALTGRWGTFLALAAVLLASDMLRTADGGQDRRVIFAVAIIAITAHLVAGRYGWFGRYEVYIVAVTILGLVAIPRDFFRGTGDLGSVMGVVGCLLVIAAPYAYTTAMTPAAAANIYQQQYQMHRFSSQFFPYAVAVNDLGWVAYRNKNYVLDLWGLGSEEARQLRQSRRWTSEALRKVTTRKDVMYAMIYDAWFDEVPSEWCKIATLNTSQVTAASGVVSIYLLKAEYSRQMTTALTAFSSKLPKGAWLDINGCGNLQ